MPKVENKKKTEGVERVQFELSKEGLQAVLDGLGKIRDQLSATSR